MTPRMESLEEEWASPFRQGAGGALRKGEEGYIRYNIERHRGIMLGLPRDPGFKERKGIESIMPRVPPVCL